MGLRAVIAEYVLWIISSENVDGKTNNASVPWRPKGQDPRMV